MWKYVGDVGKSVELFHDDRFFDLALKEFLLSIKYKLPFICGKTAIYSFVIYNQSF